MLGVANHIVSSHSINKLAKTLEDVDINEKEDRSNEKNNEVSSQLITNYSILAGEKIWVPIPCSFTPKALNIDKPLKNERSISLSFRSKFNFWSLTSFLTKEALTWKVCLHGATERQYGLLERYLCYLSTFEYDVVTDLPVFFRFFFNQKCCRKLVQGPNVNFISPRWMTNNGIWRLNVELKLRNESSSHIKS